MLDKVLAAYNDAIMKAFQLALVVICVMSIGALGMKWTSVKTSHLTTTANSRTPGQEDSLDT